MGRTNCEIDDIKVPKNPAVPIARVKFEIRLLNYRGKPMAGANCVLDWTTPKTGAEHLKGVTDGDGVVRFAVPTPAATRVHSGTLKVEVFPSAPPLELNVVLLGTIRPTDDPEGVKVRLNNLGYTEDLTAALGSTFQQPFVRALERFRFANKIFDPKTLAPIGPAAPPLEPATKDRLEQAHDTRGPLLVP